MKIYATEVDAKITKTEGVVRVIRGKEAKQVVEGDTISRGGRVILQEGSYLVLQPLNSPDAKPIVLNTHSPFSPTPNATSTIPPANSPSKPAPAESKDKAPIAALSVGGDPPTTTNVVYNNRDIEEAYLGLEDLVESGMTNPEDIPHMGNIVVEDILDTGDSASLDMQLLKLEDTKKPQQRDNGKNKKEVKKPEIDSPSISDAEVIMLFSPTTITVS